MNIFFLLVLLELRATSSLSGSYANIGNKGLVGKKLSSVDVWKAPAWPSDSSFSEAQSDSSPPVALHSISGGILEWGGLLVGLGFFCNHYWIKPFSRASYTIWFFQVRAVLSAVLSDFPLAEVTADTWLYYHSTWTAAKYFILLVVWAMLLSHIDHFLLWFSSDMEICKMLNWKVSARNFRA